MGGRIPRTLLKLLTYCRVSDKSTCEVLLELGKVKVNGEMCDDPVKLVRMQAFWIEEFFGGGLASSAFSPAYRPTDHTFPSTKPRHDRWTLSRTRSSSTASR